MRQLFQGMIILSVNRGSSCGLLGGLAFEKMTGFQSLRIRLLILVTLAIETPPITEIIAPEKKKKKESLCILQSLISGLSS